MSANLIQGTQEWLDVRKNFLGASDAPIIMGVGFRTPYQLWQQKMDPNYQEETNRAMQRGTDMEPIARAAYEAYTGNKVNPDVIFHPTHKFMMASLDGLTENKQMAVEIKNVNEEDHDTALKGKVPKKYIPQVQHQLEILFTLYGVDMLHYFSFRNGEGALVEVERDERYAERLISKEREFWDKYILGLEAPPLTDKDYISMDLCDRWLKIDDRLGEVEEQLSQLTKEKAELKDELIELSGGRNAKGGRIKLTKVFKKGAINYDAIPQLKGVDREAYRKEGFSYWLPTRK